jgi:uncharacterized protein YdaU (DUF1376 family)
MPFHTGEFLAETAHLNHLQIAVYAFLLIHYWHKRGLPADNPSLARIAKLSTRAWINIRPAIAPLFFEQQRDGKPDIWQHLRLEKELAQRDAVAARRAAAGSKGGHRKSMNAVLGLAEFPLKMSANRQALISPNLLKTLKRN